MRRAPNRSVGWRSPSWPWPWSWPWPTVIRFNGFMGWASSLPEPPLYHQRRDLRIFTKAPSPNTAVSVPVDVATIVVSATCGQNLGKKGIPMSKNTRSQIGKNPQAKYTQFQPFLGAASRSSRGESLPCKGFVLHINALAFTCWRPSAADRLLGSPLVQSMCAPSPNAGHLRKNREERRIRGVQKLAEIHGFSGSVPPVLPVDPS